MCLESAMNTLQDALPLDQPETYSCQLYGYIRSHQQLWIQVSRQKETFYLFFQAVFFFSGATGWLGADFVLESPETCLDFLRSAGLYERFDKAPDDVLKKLLRLYGVRG